MKYIKTKFETTPSNEVITDILCTLMGEAKYESFETNNIGVDGYIQSTFYNEDIVKGIINDFPLENVSITYTNENMPDEDWNETWEKNHFQPVVIDKKCTIYSTYHVNVPQTKYNIVINPKLAFGTGTHQTTHLLIKEIMENDVHGKSLLDMGCGTSILAILASMKGADPITAIDIDEWSVINSKENFKLNDIHNIDVRQGDASSLNGLQPFDIIIANINRNILMNDMKMYASVMHKGSEIWMSGFYEEDMNLITHKAEEYGLQLLYHKSFDNWAVMKFLMA